MNEIDIAKNVFGPHLSMLKGKTVTGKYTSPKNIITIRAKKSSKKDCISHRHNDNQWMWILGHNIT